MHRSGIPHPHWQSEKRTPSCRLHQPNPVHTAGTLHPIPQPYTIAVGPMAIEQPRPTPTHSFQALSRHQANNLEELAQSHERGCQSKWAYIHIHWNPSYWAGVPVNFYQRDKGYPSLHTLIYQGPSLERACPWTLSPHRCRATMHARSIPPNYDWIGDQYCWKPEPLIIWQGSVWAIQPHHYSVSCSVPSDKWGIRRESGIMVSMGHHLCWNGAQRATWQQQHAWAQTGQEHGIRLHWQGL